MCDLRIRIEGQVGRGERVSEFGQLLREIDLALPSIARHVIRTHLDLTRPENQAFLEVPDRREHHQAQWHTWGIITHTRVFLRLYQSEVPALLEEWGLRDAVDAALAREIDGVTRADLLKLTILLHDLGKFGARTIGKTAFHFGGHERLSGTIIRRDLPVLREQLTPGQLEYVAVTAEDHFVLGLVRKHAREAGEFTASYPASETFRQVAARIRTEHPVDALEIGVLFLGDSLAKVDPRNPPERARSQGPLNVAIARRYLEEVVAHAADILEPR